ncbi:hypothetical protein BC830DRAFT_1091372 [Chytriomyces sp. MP71]|nr:hypothetical protein BC830DRAFT_1091372 [Chytriomyces sp. MP71]
MSLGFSSIETLSSTASVDASSLALSGADGWNTSEQSTEIIDLTLDDDFLHVASHGFGLFPAQPSEGKPVLMQDCTRMDSDTSLSSISPSDFNLGSSSFDAPSQEKLKQAFQVVIEFSCTPSPFPLHRILERASRLFLEVSFQIVTSNFQQFFFCRV